MGFRLHIDIPIVLPGDILPGDINAIASASEQACEIIDCVLSIIQDQCPSVNQVNYRLGNDDDRGGSNYLTINENGHCSNKKTKWFK